MHLKRISVQVLVVLLSSSLFLMAAEATGPLRRGAEVQAAWVDLSVGDLERSAGSTRVRNAMEEMEGITGLAIRLDEPIISVRYDPSQTRPEWRTRFAQARMRLRQAEKNAWRIVTRIVLVGGGTGLGGTGRGVAIPVPMKVWEFVETDELRGARQALEALEEELRRAGLAHGWSRE